MVSKKGSVVSSLHGQLLLNRRTLSFLSPYKTVVIKMSQGERNECSAERSHSPKEVGWGRGEEAEIQAALAQFPSLSAVLSFRK